MAAFQIDRYEVRVGVVGQGQGVRSYRSLHLWSVPGDAGEVHFVDITYWRGPNAQLGAELWFIAPDGSRRITATADTRDFDAAYRVLNREAPTFFTYLVVDDNGAIVLDPVAPANVASAQIGTSKEVPGEGPVDPDAT